MDNLNVNNITIFFIATLLLVLTVFTNNVYGQENKKRSDKIEIKQLNIMSGKSGIYILNDKNIKRFVMDNEGAIRRKLGSTYLSEQELDSIDFFANDIIEHLEADLYADDNVLDGWKWTVSIEKDSINNIYTFENCSCIYVNRLINYLNLKLGKKMLIYPMDYMGENDCCSDEMEK